MDKTLFSTERLMVRVADVSDLDLFDELWHCAKVMWNVGFPSGLPLTRGTIESLLKKQAIDDEVFDKRLVVILKETGQKIGEAKLGKTNKEGVSEPDVKLLPDFWRCGYGLEVMGGMLQFIFEHSETTIVQTTPRVSNVGSHKMIEAYGGVRVMDEQVFEVPEGEEAFQEPVPFYTFHLKKEDYIKHLSG